MLSPLPRRSDWAYGFAHSPNRVSLPRYGSRVDLRIVLFEACSAFTRVTACTLALSPIRDTLIRRLQPLRFLHSCSGCFRLERSPGGICTHWKSAAFSRRTPLADSCSATNNLVGAGKHRCHCKSERFSGFQVDDQLELGRRLHWN